MTTLKPKPIARTRRELGALAKRRLKALAEAEPPQPVDGGPALIFKAMDALPGYTYPTMGATLALAGGKWALSRELRISNKQTIAKIRIGLTKKGVL